GALRGGKDQAKAPDDVGARYFVKPDRRNAGDAASAGSSEIAPLDISRRSARVAYDALQLRGDGEGAQAG
ncbi:hypothetical protein NON27_27890, partial [Vibrio parahaemolyticus]|nr:hypothetical protein [Vibrio parahaemolyticus]